MDTATYIDKAERLKALNQLLEHPAYEFLVEAIGQKIEESRRVACSLKEKRKVRDGAAGAAEALTELLALPKVTAASLEATLQNARREKKRV